MGSQAARRIDEDEGAASAESSPEEFLREIFVRCIRDYLENLHPSRHPARAKARKVEWVDDNKIRRTFEIKPNASFVSLLADDASYEHQRQFYVFVLTLGLRQLFAKSGESAEEGDSKTKLDLGLLLTRSYWDEALMFDEAGKGNAVAKQICDILRIDRASVANSKRCGYKGLNVRDALSELRVRLRRGLLWRDEPWWPKLPEPEEESSE